LSIEATRIDVLKMLLYAPSPSAPKPGSRGIIGKTRLQKEVFLAQKSLQDNHIKRKYGFMPYRYGPFSRQLYFDINLLQSQGLVEEKTDLGESGFTREYRLTAAGIREVESMIQNVEFKKIYDIVREIKRKYNETPLVDLVEFTHREFPEFLAEAAYNY
jgi:uncharacterized protein YwgA